MGCCQSTKPPPPSPPPPPFQRHHSKSSRAPPPVEEETVKEVLSETPTNPNLHFSKSIQNQPQNNRHEEDVSISSEICSNMSETISTGTTFEEDVEGFRRRVAERSPAKLRNRNNISPARGKHQSPSRVRSVSETNNRGSGFGSAGRQRPMAARREVSRSRSPANRTAGRGGGDRGRKSPAARKVDNSPGRVRPRLPLTKPELSSVREREREREERSNWSPLEVNGDEDESIDNPLVSLECFIFL